MEERTERRVREELRKNAIPWEFEIEKTRFLGSWRRLEMRKSERVINCNGK